MSQKSRVIIGGTSHIGFSIVNQLKSDQKANTFVSYRNQDKFNEFYEHHDLTGIYIDFNEPFRMNTFDQMEQINEVIICYGEEWFELFHECNGKAIEQYINAHITQFTIMLTEFTRRMIQQKSGKIILIGSIFGEVPASYEAIYSSVKAYQHQLIKSLAKELAPSNVQCSIIAPGVVTGGMTDRLDRETIDVLKSDIPTGQFVTAETIAEWVEFLLNQSDLSHTGQVISLNGGWHIQ
ncbi:SDR family NAD(P)-dependent oxidoreductase [Abyssicoccus albus]|uniref:SDR family NAD(P)-dependent oxidoreductase n=1 Tax=Abyssicoccus albus TaxID=1817405 RepID=UPI00097E2F44|nr:SDR family NAD(P)-dependent oxidoreductase [Abyssicoccus albus]AQL56288.1 hypothetical protein BVH56_04840 [Abyssicoccus albus]